MKGITTLGGAWLSSSALVSINVATLRQARLILGVCGRVNHLKKNLLGYIPVLNVTAHSFTMP